MSNAIETAMFLRRYQSWRKGEIDVFYPDSHAGPNPVEISAAIDRAIVALEAQPPCGADGADWVDRAMTLAQEFASSWSLVGGRFDDGDMLESAEQRKAELRALLASQPAAPVAPATVEVPKDAPQSFITYMKQNYPPDTVIVDGAWHARAIWGAARYAMLAASQQK